MNHETVGSLLAVIANSINDAIRTLTFADKTAWGKDEFEQLNLVEDTLDLAKKDFQELPELINGRLYYEHDRTRESLEDLRDLCTRFELHARTFKDWLRSGGPIDPTWASETIQLRRELHRAQCRAVRRIHATQQQTRTRCLGAQQVYKIQQQADGDQNQRLLEEAAMCNQTGKFERFGDNDVAFVCDYCDGYIVWQDVRELPSTRNVDDLNKASSPSGEEVELTVSANGLPRTSTWASETMPFGTGLAIDAAAAAASRDGNSLASDSYALAQRQWQAMGYSMTTGAQKSIVFAPLAIANHVAPDSRDWQAGLLCPFCDDYYYVEQGDPDVDQIKYVQNENGFVDLSALQEHLEWYHAPLVSQTSSCRVM